MVLIAKWLLEHDPEARILIITDRDELDKQIEGVMRNAGVIGVESPSPRIASTIGSLHPVANGVGQCHFGHIARVVGAFARPIAEGRAEAVGHSRYSSDPNPMEQKFHFSAKLDFHTWLF
jgi:hypothetical protein